MVFIIMCRTAITGYRWKLNNDSISFTAELAETTITHTKIISHADCAEALVDAVNEYYLSIMSSDPKAAPNVYVLFIFMRTTHSTLSTLTHTYISAFSLSTFGQEMMECRA